MEKVKEREEDNHFLDCWEEKNADCTFLDFAAFIIREMGFSFHTKEELEQVRRPAFLKFRKLTGRHSFASMPTMRRWFGIGGNATPGREQVFAICLALKTGPDQAERFLTVGLGETSFLFQDYRELIFHYGLYKKLTYTVCQSLIHRFEDQWSPSFPETPGMDRTSFFREYKAAKEKAPQAFLLWMLQCQDFFVGYSPETLDVLMACRKEITEFIRREARDKLRSLLAETNYTTWRKNRRFQNLGMRDILRRYVRTHQSDSYYKVSENMGDNILELSQIAYSGLEANSKLLAEIFSTSKQEKSQKERKLFHNVKGMTAKRLSDLFNIPIQKKRSFLMKKSNCRLCSFAPDVTCPDWFVEMADECARKHPAFATVEEARKWLSYYLSEQKRRCIDVCRNDILPLVHYIAQHRYLEELGKRNDVYNAKKAKQEFVTLANETLALCRMAPVSEDYELDTLLLLCFQPEEMYSFAEVLDLAEGIE